MAERSRRFYETASPLRLPARGAHAFKAIYMYERSPLPTPVLTVAATDNGAVAAGPSWCPASCP